MQIDEEKKTKMNTIFDLINSNPDIIGLVLGVVVVVVWVVAVLKS